MAKSGPQPAVFSYFHFNPSIHNHEKPYEILINLPSSDNGKSEYRRHNQEFEDREAVVQDVRGFEDQFSLNSNGVCWRKWEGPAEWRDLKAEGVMKLGHEHIRSGYIKAVEHFIGQELEKQDGKPVDIVKVFDYRLRVSSDPEEFEARVLNLNDGLDPVIPATHPHVDQSFLGSKMRVRVHMGESADELLKRRYRIINVWKPLVEVENWPLGVCDSRTVELEDLVTSDLVRRKYVGETFYSKYNPNHRWYYLSRQLPEEVTMLKIHDSDQSTDVRFSLHSSFLIQDHEIGNHRESFEVRALVFDAKE
ncbi:hypothetical protein E8E14_010510 [Neopestalotiopsis sp. 37M]|nr:hypothetical protein E8E14_010510 [Neopestalotiopsis sp. 37M]